MSIDSAAASETERAGGDLARGLQAGDVVLLSGELGAGKTTFVRGACRAFGIDDAVRSPTFTIGNLYPTGPGAPVAQVAHLDLYRLADLGSEDPDLLADYIRADTISFVEWPGGADDAIAELAQIRFRVTLEHAGGDARVITIQAARA